MACKVEIQTIELDQYETASIKATIYHGSANNQSTILYLHGGGLIFGNRDDLPSDYIEKFVAAGHPFVTLDYLLAPESKLDVILTVLNRSINQLKAQSLMNDNLVLMGRSAGAYLAYLLIRDGLKANALIDLYGYSRLDYPEFHLPAPYYNQFPKVLPMAAQAQVGATPISAGEMKDRYPIYVSARQFGTWMSMVLPTQQAIQTYSLTDEALNQLPKTIMLHSTDDPDVPFTAAQNAAAIMAAATLVPVPSQEHDFDREVTANNLAYYDQIIDFIS